MRSLTDAVLRHLTRTAAHHLDQAIPELSAGSVHRQRLAHDNSRFTGENPQRTLRNLEIEAIAAEVGATPAHRERWPWLRAKGDDIAPIPQGLDRRAPSEGNQMRRRGRCPVEAKLW